MKRREALKNVSLFVSGTLAIPTGSILLNSCSNPTKELEWNPGDIFKDITTWLQKKD